MDGFELNKIAAAVLLTGLSMMIIGTVVDSIYVPEKHPEKRGFHIEVAEEAPAGGGAAAPAAPIVFKVGQLMAAANVEAGKESAKKCTACHSFDKGGPNKVGPDLWNKVNNPKLGSAEFAYSDGMKEKAKTDPKWTYDNLFHFINNPKAYVPGTKMGFAGIKKPEEIANLIAYLRSLSDSPAPLPPVEKK